MVAHKHDDWCQRERERKKGDRVPREIDATSPHPPTPHHVPAFILSLIAHKIEQREGGGDDLISLKEMYLVVVGEIQFFQNLGN